MKCKDSKLYKFYSPASKSTYWSIAAEQPVEKYHVKLEQLAESIDDIEANSTCALQYSAEGQVLGANTSWYISRNVPTTRLDLNLNGITLLPHDSCHLRTTRRAAVRLGPPAIRKLTSHAFSCLLIVHNSLGWMSSLRRV